jgi:hypothetical protein
VLDLVTHDDARPALPAVHLEGRTTLTYGELAELVGEFERALRCDGKALVLCAGDRDLGTTIFQGENSRPAGEIYIDTVLLLATSGSAGRPKTADRR